MQAIPDHSPLLVWDGGSRIAFAFGPMGPEYYASVIAHGPETSSCIAVWEVAAGLCIAELPANAQHLDIAIVSATGDSRDLAVELDGQLLPAMVDLTQQGLVSVRLDLTAGRLAHETGMPDAGLMSLNLLARGSAGERMKVGPLVDAAADATVTTVSLETTLGAPHVTIHRPGGASPVLLADIPAAAEALRSSSPDVTGVAGDDAAARGFRLVSASATSGPDLPLWQDARPDDRLLVLAPRSHRIRFGQSGKPGTRLLLAMAEDGSITADITTHAYRPATSTALAALGGRGNALATADAGDVESSVVDRAAALAEAWWKRERQGGLIASPWLTDAPLVQVDAYPMARLTRAGLAHPDSGVSPLTAAMGAALALPPALVEEIEALPATDRAALVRWTALAPDIAGDAVRARISLTDAETGSGMTIVGEQVSLAADPGFPVQMAELAERLAPKAASAERRQEISVIQSFADKDQPIWMTSGELAEALALLARNPAPTPVLSPAARLIADIKRDQKIWSVAQREAASVDLAIIAERRAMIPIAAVGAGIGGDTAADIEGRLPSLSGAEIILLHRYLTVAAQRHALVRAVKLAVMALDDAAGSRGLAARMDRSGDPLVGMTRIGSAAEGVVRELISMPQARDALVQLTNWINACLPPVEAGHALSEQIVRNLKSYGCFLLMHAVAAECRVQLEGSGESAAAFVKRLNSGLAETLPRFAAAASARAADDLRLGLAFTARLPVLHGKAAA